MAGNTRKIKNVLPDGVLFAALPGPTRKRVPTAYCYRLAHKGGAEEVGCAMLWEVFGGREVYQVALEREANGSLRWHCTCADAAYRGDGRHQCKHIRGLIEQGRKEPVEATVPV